MQYIPINKTINEDGNEQYSIPAIPLKNTKNSVVQKIPHPLGTDTLIFTTLEDAKNAVARAGFSCVLPNGKKETSISGNSQNKQITDNYEKIVLDAIKSKVNSSNSSVCASAVMALSEFPSEENFEILFEKLGEDNDLVRKNAIAGICKYANLLTDKIVASLNSNNWVTRNSAVNCILNLAEDENFQLEKFIIPLSKACEDTNTIVQTNAICAIAKVYRNYKKQKLNL